MSIQITDHSREVMNAINNNIERALEKCGLLAEGYAIDECPVDTGNLRNSIAHKVVPNEKSTYIGTTVKYGKYVEFGTGKYYDGGRQTPWAFQDSNGNWYRTSCNKHQPFLKPAVTEHKDEYKRIIDEEMRF